MCIVGFDNLSIVSTPKREEIAGYHINAREANVLVFLWQCKNSKPLFLIVYTVPIILG